MPLLTLFHNDMSTCSQKVRLVFAEKGLDYESRHLNLRAGEQHRPDYLEINPKGVVPALLADGVPIVESNIICEFLDDLMPDIPLRPAEPVAAAQMRLWMHKLDDGIHADTGVVSSAIAFRYQKFEKGEAHARKLVEDIPDEAKRERMRSIVFDGVDSPLFLKSISRFDGLLEQMESALSGQDWLAGNEFSLADAALSPYITRLDQLHLSGMWSARPRIADWYDRLRRRESYRVGFVDFFSDAYLTLMEEKGRETWPKVKAHLAAA